MRRLAMWYAAPVAVAAVVVAVAVGIWEALGVVIAFGLFGLMVWVWVFTVNVTERQNAEIVLADGRLLLGTNGVAVDDVVWFTTYPSRFHGPISLYTRVFTPHYLTLPAGDARFVTKDGRTVEWFWASMTPEQVDEVRAALEAVLPGRWRPAN